MPAGRPKGSKNKNASEFQALYDKYCRKYKMDPIETHFLLMGPIEPGGDANPKNIRLQAANNLLPYRFSKMTEEKREEKQESFVFGWADDEYQAIDINEPATTEH